MHTHGTVDLAPSLYSKPVGGSRGRARSLYTLLVRVILQATRRMMLD